MVERQFSFLVFFKIPDFQKWTCPHSRLEWQVLNAGLGEWMPKGKRIFIPVRFTEDDRESPEPRVDFCDCFSR